MEDICIKEIRANEVIHKGITSFAENTLENLANAHNAIIEARVTQARKANRKRGPELETKAGDLVYCHINVSTKNFNLPKGRARKLCPKYVGPYKVLQASLETST
ncbi:hypothetical protein BD779DRAFT_1458585, partial [Infundibulicybe gibba]